MLKAVLFDLDGTLLNTLPDLHTSVNVALAELGLPPRTEDEVRSFVGNGVDKLIERALGAARAEPLPYGDDLHARAKALFQAHYADHMADETAPYPGVIELLGALRDRGIIRAVISNKYDDAVQVVCAQYFGDLCDLAIGESEEIPPKPAPDGSWKALKMLGIDAGEAVYVGDSDVDAQTAHNASLRFIGVTWGFRSREVLERAGAEVIVDTAEELLAVLAKEW